MKKSFQWLPLAQSKSQCPHNGVHIYVSDLSIASQMSSSTHPFALLIMGKSALLLFHAHWRTYTA